MSSGNPQQISRAIRNCTNNTNIDTIQCEAYAPKLRQRPPITGIMGPQPKSVHTKPNRERSTSRSRCAQSSVVPNIFGRYPNNNNVSVLHNRVRRENSVSSVVRKEVYTSADKPALVEVTVKTHGQQNVPQHRKQSVKSINMGNQGEPWNKILQQNNLLSGIVSEENSFSNFDPLRTVHFLAQELHSKIQNSLSDDDHSIRQIICDMQQALHRVPPEIASSLGLSISPQYMIQHKPPATPIINGSFNYDYPTKDDLRQERLGIVKGDTISNTVERGCQTAKCRNMVLEPEKFQQHLEFSTAKIESACRQMEVVCSKLKTDKEELERELLTEQEIVLKLRTQLEQTSCQQDATKLNVEHLQTERNSLQQELQQLKLQLIGTTSQSQLLQQLQSQKIAVEEQLANYKQQLTIAKMETEKYVAILAARDKQVTEIRSEMNQLQELVIEQLREIQTGPFSSSVTSCTTNTTSKQSFTWPPTQKRDIHKEIVGAMEATTDMIINNGAGSTTCNGGETTATNSGVSSTTTISNVNMGSSTKDVLTSKMVQIDFTANRDRQQNGNSKSNVDMSNVRMEANLMLDTCGGINNDNEIVNNKQRRTNISGQLHSVSVREMFAEIKKQAFLINAIPQKST